MIGGLCLALSAGVAGLVWSLGLGGDATETSKEKVNSPRPSTVESKAKDAPEELVLKVRVTDEKMSPIADAKVWLFLTLDPRLQNKNRAFGVSSADGATSLSFPKVWVEGVQEHLLFYNVWIVQDGFAVKAQSISRRKLLMQTTMTVVLKESSPRNFRILSPHDEPVATTVSLDSDPINVVPEEIRRHVMSRSGDDGLTTLRGLPNEKHLGIRVESDTYGSQIFIQAATADKIRLTPVGRVEGIVVAERPEWVAGVSIAVLTNSGADSPTSFGEARVTTDKDGKLVIPAIAAGHLGFHFFVPPEWPVRPKRDAKLQVVAGETQTVEFRMEKTVRLLGSVQAGGRPLPKLRVHIVHGVDEELRNVTITDLRGRFEAYVLPGKVHFSAGFSDGLAHYKIKDFDALDVTVPASAPTFETPPLEVVPTQ